MALNPSNKTQSLRVDAMGRLLTTGGSGGGGSSGALSSFKATVNKTLAGTSDTKIAFYSDSTGAGDCGGGSTWTNARPWCRAAQAAVILNARGIPARSSSFFGNQNVGSTLGDAVNLYDPRLAVGAGWVTQTQGLPGIGGLMFAHNTNGSTSVLSMAATEVCDTVDIWYITNGGYGSFDLLIDGVKNGATIVCNGGLALQKVTRSFTAGVHTLGAQKAANGTVFIVGVDAYHSAVKSIRCWNVSAGGATAATGAASTDLWDSLNALKALKPDLTVIGYSINDFMGSTPAATYLTNMTAIIEAARLSGDVLLETPCPSNYSAASQSVQDSIIVPLRQLAVNKGCMLADVNAAMRNYTSAATAGYFAPQADPVHPGPTGYTFWAQNTITALFG